MQGHTNGGDPAPRRSGRFKVFKWALVVFAVLLLLGFLLVPVFLSSESGKKLIVNTVNESVDGKFDMGGFSVGWFKGVHLTDMSFSDNSGLMSVSVKDISGKPKYCSLLMGSVSLGDAVVDTPEVVITLPAEVDEGVTEKTERPGKSVAVDADGLDLKRLDLTIKNGNVRIEQAGRDGTIETLQFANIASKFDLHPAGKESSFDVAFAVGDENNLSEISAAGKVKSKKWRPAQTSGDLTVKIDDLDMASLGPLFAFLGKKVDIGGKLNADIDASIVKGWPEKVSANATLTGFTQKIDGREILLTEPVTLDAEISSDADAVKIDKLDLKSPFCSIESTGGKNWLDYSAKFDIAKMMPLVRPFNDLGGFTFAGTGTEKGRITFDLDKGKIDCKGVSMVKDFVVSTPEKVATPVTSATIGFDLAADTKKSILSIDSLIVDASPGLGKVEISNSIIPYADDKKGMNIGVSADLDIARAMEFAKVFDAASDDKSIAGRVQSKISITEVKEGLRLLTDATRITNLVIAGTGTDEVFKDPKVDLMFDVILNFEEKTYDFRKLNIDASQIDIEGSLRQSTSKGATTVGGELTAAYDLAEVSKEAAVSDYIPQGLKMEGKRNDKITFQSRYPSGQKDKRLANMNANATLGFDKADYIGLRFGKTDVKVLVKDGVAEIPPFSTVVNEGKFNFAGRLDLQKKPMLFEIPAPMQVIEKINIDERMAREMLRYLNPVFADQANISGVADLHCKKLAIPLGSDADISRAEIRGTVAMSNMRMQPVGLLGQILSRAKARSENKAELLPTEFVLTGGKLSYDNMQLNVDGYPTNFKGAIILAGLTKPLDMMVALPYELQFDGIKPNLETIRVGDGREASKDRVSLPIEGTVDKNGINWNKFFDEILKKMPERILEEQLKDIFKKKGTGDKAGEAEEKIGEILEGIFN